ALIGLQPDPRGDGQGSRGPRQATATLELQGDAADDDGVPGRVATGDTKRPRTLGQGDAQGDLAPPRRRSIWPRRAARQQAPAEAATLSHGTATSGAQTFDANSVMANPSAIRDCGVFSLRGNRRPLGEIVGD